MKKTTTEIKQHPFDASFFKLHKDGAGGSNFGLDHSTELIDGGFGLYSTVNLKARIEPIKTEYFRIGLVRGGRTKMTIGLETYEPARNSIVFGFPGQIYSLYDKSDDFFAYYLLFKADFMPEGMLLKDGREQYPFYSYAGTQSFSLSEQEAGEIEQFIFKVNEEVKSRKPDMSRAIRLYIQLILFQANRSYERQQLAQKESATGGNALFRRFIKLVSQHFLRLRKVSDYAGLLHVSADHLNRAIKSHSEKTAHELIEEMILLEAKAYLLNTELSNAEIAYRLEFSDPSHFNKFFKKQMRCTPVEYRGQS